MRGTLAAIGGGLIIGAAAATFIDGGHEAVPIVAGGLGVLFLWASMFRQGGKQ